MPKMFKLSFDEMLYACKLYTGHHTVVVGGADVVLHELHANGSAVIPPCYNPAGEKLNKSAKAPFDYTHGWQGLSETQAIQYLGRTNIQANLLRAQYLGRFGFDTKELENVLTVTCYLMDNLYKIARNEPVYNEDQKQQLFEMYGAWDKGLYDMAKELHHHVLNFDNPQAISQAGINHAVPIIRQFNTQLHELVKFKVFGQKQQHAHTM